MYGDRENSRAPGSAAHQSPDSLRRSSMAKKNASATFRAMDALWMPMAPRNGYRGSVSTTLSRHSE